MKKLNKIISVALAAVLVASVGAGCKKEKAAVTNADGSYAPQKELSVTIWNAQGTEFVQQEAPADDIPAKWLHDKTLVKIENIYGNDGGQWDTKLSRLIAGDNMPELFYIAGGQGPTHFKKLQDAKTLYPLTEELIKEYAPNVWERVPKDYWDMMRSGDTILGIPFGFDRYDEETQPNATEQERKFMTENNAPIITNYCTLHIRDDIAKKLFPEIKGYDELCAIIDENGAALGENNNKFPIYSTDDFVKMFRDINAMGLTENGKKVYAFGYNGGDLWLPFTILGASMGGYATNNYISHWNPNTKEIDLPLKGEVIKNAAKIQNELIRDDVFDPESLIHSSTDFKENCLNGLYAVTDLDYAGGMMQINDQLEALGKPFRYIPLLTSVEQNKDYPLQSYSSPWTAAITLTNKLDDEGAKQVLNWINTMFSDEFEEVLWWGTPEDGLYTEENGTRKYTDDKFNRSFIDMDSNALTVKESKGIGTVGAVPEARFYVLAGFNPKISRWNPSVIAMKNTINSSMQSGFLPAKSDENAKQRPQSEVYDALYADVEECVEFWAKREQWESPFKMSLGADSPESFENQWQAAIDNLNKITDTDEMCRKMTEKARAQAKEMGIE